MRKNYDTCNEQEVKEAKEPCSIILVCLFLMVTNIDVKHFCLPAFALLSSPVVTHPCTFGNPIHQVIRPIQLR